MVGEPLELLGRAVDAEPLHGLDDADVKDTAAILEQGAIRDLVGEGVLEGVLKVREEPDLVQELGSLQPGEPLGERIVRKLGDGLEEGERHIGAPHLQITDRTRPPSTSIVVPVM
jgi:hypothetical protein